MTKTRAPLIALAAVLALLALSAEGCETPLVKKGASKCSKSQRGKAAVDGAGNELVCSGPRPDGSYRWLVSPN